MKRVQLYKEDIKVSEIVDDSIWKAAAAAGGGK
jgi:hypothetical protein